MFLKNKTKYTVPVNGTKARALRVIEVPDDCEYDENKFEKINKTKSQPKKKVVKEE